MKKLLLLVALIIPSILHAQTRLAFGYECGDRFLIKNDGTQAVDVRYTVAGLSDTSQMHLKVGESKEIAIAQTGNLDLFVNKKLVASEPKGNSVCQSTKDSVIVTPLSEVIAPTVVYSPPACTYYWMGCYGYYPYSYSLFPFYNNHIEIIRSRGGFGRGVVGHRHR